MAIGLGDLSKKKNGHEEASHSIKKKNLLPWQSFTQDNSNTSTHLRAYEALNKARERVKEDVYKDVHKDIHKDIDTVTEGRDHRECQERQEQVTTQPPLAEEISATKIFLPSRAHDSFSSSINHFNHFNRPKSTLWSFIREVLL